VRPEHPFRARVERARGRPGLAVRRPRPGVVAQAQAVVGGLAASACPLPGRLVMAVRFAAVGWRLGGLRARLARRRAFVSRFLGHRDRRRRPR
jgi:hypothetical protein